MTKKPASYSLSWESCYVDVFRNRSGWTSPDDYLRFDLHSKLETPTPANKAHLKQYKFNDFTMCLSVLDTNSWHPIFPEPAGRCKQYLVPKVYYPVQLVFQTLLCK